MAFAVSKKAFCLGICQNWVNCDCATEVSDHVPHRTTYRQNNSWIVHEFQQSGCLCAAKRTGSHSAGIHVPFTNCFVCMWFCVIHDPKPPLHSHNWLSFGKFQDRTLSYSLRTPFFFTTMTFTRSCSYNFMYSWWWVRCTTEICRVILQ